MIKKKKKEAPNVSFIIDPNNKTSTKAISDAKILATQAPYLQVNYLNSKFLLCFVKTPVIGMSSWMIKAR